MKSSRPFRSLATKQADTITHLNGIIIKRNIEIVEVREAIAGLLSKNDRMQELLVEMKNLLSHAPEFPLSLVRKYDIEELQERIEKELRRSNE